MEIKRELLLLRKALRHQGEVLDALLLQYRRDSADSAGGNPHDDASAAAAAASAAVPTGPPSTRLVYYDNFNELRQRFRSNMELLETYRELCTSIQELVNMDADHEMNKVLYFLTLVTTVFVPCSFLAGVYGMNFRTLPELEWKYAYPVWWAVVLVVMVSFAIFFTRFRRVL